MMKILIAEDEDGVAMLAKFKLEKKGYRVIRAVDGEEAIKLVKNEKPDLVLLDVMMKFFNGFEVLDEIKSDPEIKHIPVIMLTSKSDETSVVRGLEKGARDYITKPFSPSELIARVKKVLAKE